MLNGLLNVLFSVRIFPVFITMVIFLLSLASHTDLNLFFSNVNEKIVLIYSLFLALIFAYLLSGIQENKTLSTSAIYFILFSILMFQAIKGWKLDEIMENIQDRPHIAAVAASPLLIIPLVTLIMMSPEKRFGASGLGMLAISIVGGIIIGLNSNAIIKGPTVKKSKLYRLLFGIVISSVCLLSYMFLWVRHTGQYEKQAVVFWFLTAVATIIIREYDALKNSDIPDWVWFMSISLTTLMSLYLLYANPVQGDFTQYNTAIATISMLAGFVIYYLRATQLYDSDRLGMSEIIWIWLLSFVNLTILDGYVKYASMKKRAYLEFDSVSKTFVRLPLFINTFLALYTTYMGFKRSTSLDNEEIGTTKLSWLTVFTYLAGLFSYLFNVTDLKEKLIGEIIENMEYASA